MGVHDWSDLAIVKYSPEVDFGLFTSTQQSCVTVGGSIAVSPPLSLKLSQRPMSKFQIMLKDKALHLYAEMPMSVFWCGESAEISIDLACPLKTLPDLSGMDGGENAQLLLRIYRSATNEPGLSAEKVFASSRTELNLQPVSTTINSFPVNSTDIHAHLEPLKSSQPIISIPFESHAIAPPSALPPPTYSFSCLAARAFLTSITTSHSIQLSPGSQHLLIVPLANPYAHDVSVHIVIKNADALLDLKWGEPIDGDSRLWMKPSSSHEISLALMCLLAHFSFSLQIQFLVESRPLKILNLTLTSVASHHIDETRTFYTALNQPFHTLLRDTLADKALSNSMVCEVGGDFVRMNAASVDACSLLHLFTGNFSRVPFILGASHRVIKCVIMQLKSERIDLGLGEAKSIPFLFPFKSNLPLWISHETVQFDPHSNSLTVHALELGCKKIMVAQGWCSLIYFDVALKDEQKFLIFVNILLPVITKRFNLTLTPSTTRSNKRVSFTNPHAIPVHYTLRVTPPITLLSDKHLHMEPLATLYIRFAIERGLGYLFILNDGKCEECMHVCVE